MLKKNDLLGQWLTLEIFQKLKKGGINADFPNALKTTFQTHGHKTETSSVSLWAVSHVNGSEINHWYKHQLQSDLLQMTHLSGASKQSATV